MYFTKNSSTMKKLLFISILLLSVSNTFAQRSIGDSIYVSRDSLHFKIGDQIALGTGTMPNGDFKYIITTGVMSPGIRLGSGYSGLNVILKKIKRSGTQRLGYKYVFVVGGGNITNYSLDIEPGIKSGEILKQNGISKL